MANTSRIKYILILVVIGVLTSCQFFFSDPDEDKVISDLDETHDYYLKNIQRKASPKGTMSFEIFESGQNKDSAITQVMVNFGYPTAKGGGGVMAIKGTDIDMNVEWMNDKKIRIIIRESVEIIKKEYQIQFLNEIVELEYNIDKGNENELIALPLNFQKKMGKMCSHHQSDFPGILLFEDLDTMNRSFSLNYIPVVEAQECDQVFGKLKSQEPSEEWNILAFEVSRIPHDQLVDPYHDLDIRFPATINTYVWGKKGGYFNHINSRYITDFNTYLEYQKEMMEQYKSHQKVEKSILQSVEMPADGIYRYDIAFAEWGGKSKGEKVTVTIKGDSIMVIYEGDGNLSQTKKGEILDIGVIRKHKSGVWIITTDELDTTAEEVGGCTGGPTIIDFKNRKYWMC